MVHRSGNRPEVSEAFVTPLGDSAKKEEEGGGTRSSPLRYTNFQCKIEENSRLK